MSVPILLAANPITAKPNVWVPIRFERWIVRVEGLVDSELTFYPSNPTDPILLVNGSVYKGPCQVRVEFENRGTEKAISVFAEEYKE